MSDLPLPLGPDVSLRELVSESCVEWRSPDMYCERDYVGAVLEAPGAALVDADLRVLHIAPGTWLAINGVVGAIPSGLPDDLIGVDVSGKWRGLALPGAAATEILSAACDVEHVLCGRQCAAVTLFDCPSILLRAADGMEVWVRASYRDHLLRSISATAWGRDIAVQA